MQQNNRNHAQVTLAGVTPRYFTLQVLHAAVGEAIKSALAASIFLIAVTAVGTKKLYRVLLRIPCVRNPRRYGRALVSYLAGGDTQANRESDGRPPKLC
jgi:hypothetical protein